MSNKPDIEFDHDAPYMKHREFGKGVTYEQDGVIFSSGFEAMTILKTRRKKDAFDNMNADELRAQLRLHNIAPPKMKDRNAGKKKPQTVRQGADDKLAGFKPEDQPDHVQQAISENHAAEMADQQAE